MERNLSYLERIQALNETKNFFERQLERELSLIKVPSPLFVKSESGLQDTLTGVEQAISFMKGTEKFEIVHSLAKWKRDTLGRYDFPLYTGLYTDMKALRKDEIVDEIHSLYVEQWDWEKVIQKEDRTIDYLMDTVNRIYRVIKQTSYFVKQCYPFVTIDLPDQVTFITSQQLENMYPELTPKEREEKITKDFGAVFIIGIGNKLKSGIEHDLRSPDYDDWNLNGDMLLYDFVLDKAIEITSMGIRVDEVSLVEQLQKTKCLDRLALPYHKKIQKKELPYTIGGGLGQSRILLLLLEMTHIAEVQASSWEEKTLRGLQKKKIL